MSFQQKSSPLSGLALGIKARQPSRVRGKYSQDTLQPQTTSHALLENKITCTKEMIIKNKIGKNIAACNQH